MADEAGFGCAECFQQADSGEAWAAVRGFENLARLVEESHFSVSIRACAACGQRCVDVFTERIDWVNGEDPQTCVVLPITPGESERLVAAGGDVKLIESLGGSRRYLLWYYPADADKTVRWAQGNLWIGPHD